MERSSCISVTRVMAALSDTKSLYILFKIALAESDSEALLSETRLSTKAFYFRMSHFLKIGIISRKNGKYSLTSFGKIVYHAQDLITAALNNYWRLSALDSISMLDALPITEYNKVCDALLGEQQIKKALAQHLAQTTGKEPQICMSQISITTQRSRNTTGELQAT